MNYNFTLTPALSHPMGEGERKAASGSGAGQGKDWSAS